MAVLLKQTISKQQILMNLLFVSENTAAVYGESGF